MEHVTKGGFSLISLYLDADLHIILVLTKDCNNIYFIVCL